MAFLEALLLHAVMQGTVRVVLPLGLSAFALLAGAPACAAAPAHASPAQEVPARHVVPQEAGFQEAAAPAKPKPYVFEPGPGLPGVAVPRTESLVYRAYLNLSVVTASVGTVTQTCSVSEQAVPLVVTRPSAPAGEAASIKLEAEGSYLWYELESTLETRILPQEWPRLSYQQVSESSKGTRRREVLVGIKDGKHVSSYRGDTDKNAPKGTRIWRAAQERAVPEGTLDMLTAVFMTRALIGGKHEKLTFPLIDKNRLWELTLRRGEERRMETGAGTFDVIEVVLEPEPYEGESFAEKAEQFEGVFGIQGSMHLWVEKKTGVAVRIQGVLPINDGMIKLGIDVVLDSYTGTQEGFAPISKTAKK